MFVLLFLPGAVHYEVPSLFCTNWFAPIQDYLKTQLTKSTKRSYELNKCTPMHCNCPTDVEDPRKLDLLQ